MILSFTAKVFIDFSAGGFMESSVLRYRAVCRMFHEQCLSIIQKIAFSPSKPLIDSGKHFVSWDDLK
jgi:hypothetical protein